MGDIVPASLSASRSRGAGCRTRTGSSPSSKPSRAKLDADRADRDQRIEQATTDTILALQHRDRAVQAQHDAEVAAGTAMRALVHEDLPAGDVATLCDVPETLAKRLVVFAGRAADSAKTDTAGDTGSHH